MANAISRDELSRRRFCASAGLLTTTAIAGGMASALQSRPSDAAVADGAEIDLGAPEVVARIQKGDLKAEDYAARLLKRTAAHKNLNLVITIDEERVLQEARAVDQARARGDKLGPLSGLPVGIKDQIDVAGYPTTAGNIALKGYVAKKNAAVVETLIANGAIVFAKLNCGVMVGGGGGFTGSTTSNPYFGFARNPYDVSRIPGGSSGGSAAAVAARLVPASIGEDTGGSIRSPAAFCGIAGLRPSTYTIENALKGAHRKRYSDEGMVPPAGLLETLGPMARTVADVAFLDAVMTGERALPVNLKDVRIGIPDGAYWQHDVIDRGVAAVIEDAFKKLRDAGATLVEVDLNALIAFQRGPLGAAIGRVDRLEEWLAANAPDVSLAEINKLANSYPPRVAPDRVQLSPDQRTTILTQAAQQYADAFSKNGIAALAFPPQVIPAPLINSNGDTFGQKILVNGKWVDEAETFRFNVGFGAQVGSPGLSVPAGLTAGLPVGLSLQGLPGDDARILGLGLAVEKILGPLPAPQMLG
ncbi:MAG: amidase family protein [Rhodospirillaceae bacterium]